MSLSIENRISRIDKAMDTYPDFPKPGINFVDIFPIMRSPEVFCDLIDLLVDHIKQSHPDVETIFGLDARGFLFGPMIAQRLGISFAPIRKAGKLPGDTLQASYQLEYGSDKFEVQKCSARKGQKVIIIDDILATGGTMAAAYKLITDLGAQVLECIVLVELTELNGRSKIPGTVFSLIKRTD